MPCASCVVAHLLLAIPVTCLASCAAGVTPPSTYPVKGKVAFADGKVLHGGMIQFQPDPPNPTMTITARINVDGTFAIETHVGNKTYEGAVAGKHQVTVLGPMKNQRAEPVRVLQAEIVVEPRANDFNIAIEPVDQ